MTTTQDEPDVWEQLFDLGEEFVERHRRGQSPTIKEYAQRYPHLAGQIEAAFPMMLVVEDALDTDGNQDASDTAPRQSDADTIALPYVSDATSDRYDAGLEVAHGAMGRVLRSEDRTLRRTVAMKVILNQKDAAAQQRFVREALVLGRLEHPNIVPIHDLGRTDDGALFYTMKLVQGQTLREILKKLAAGDAETVRDFPLSRLLLVFRSICDAVAFAHDQGVIHRDLKPDNVMVGAFGEVLVMDWGLARFTTAADRETGILDALQESSTDALDVEQTEAGDGVENRVGDDQDDAAQPDQLTQHGAIIGTPRFMSPEQARGELATLDHRSDIYSLGAILYNILTLRAPVSGNRVMRILRDVISGNITSPEEFNTTPRQTSRLARAGDQQVDGSDDETVALLHCPAQRIPSSLSAVVMRSLATQPDARYQSVADLLDDIDAYERGFATSAEDISALGQATLLIKRHRIVSTCVAVMLVISVGFVVSLIQSEGRATTEAAAARMAEGVALEAQSAAEAEQEKTRQALARASIALTESAWADGSVALLKESLEACPPDLRDSTWHYFHNRLQTQAATIHHSGKRQGVGFQPGTESRPPAFVVGSGRGVFHFYHRDTGDFLRKLTITYAGKRFSVSPDGSRIAFGNRRVHILDADSGERVSQFLSRVEDMTSIMFSHDAQHVLVHSIDENVIHWLDAETGRVQWSLSPDDTVIGGRLRRCAVDPTGRFVAVSSNVSGVWVIDAATGALIRRMDPGSNFIWDLQFNHDGSLLATGDTGGYATVWEVERGNVQLRIRAGVAMLSSLAFFRDNYLITLSRESGQANSRRSLGLWELASGTLLDSRIDLPIADTFAIDQDSGQIFCDGDGVATLWRFPLKMPTLRLVGAKRLALGFLGDRHLIAGHRHGSGISLTDIGTDDLVEIWSREDVRYAVSVAVNSQGAAALFLSGTRDRFDNRLWSLQLNAAGEPIESELIWNGPQLVRMAFGQAEDRFVCWCVNDAGGQPTIRIMQSGQDAAVVEFDSPVDRRCMAIDLASQDRRIMALVGRARNSEQTEGDVLYCLDADNGRIVAQLEFAEQLRAMTVSADGRYVAVSGHDKTISVFEAMSLAPVAKFRAHDATVTSLAFHPKLPVIASGSDDLSIKLWHCETGKLLETILGPRQTPHSIGFSTSGNTLACSSADGETRLWELNVDPIQGTAE